MKLNNEEEEEVTVVACVRGCTDSGAGLYTNETGVLKCVKECNGNMSTNL